jgi:sensor domain CHASE-containing protein
MENKTGKYFKYAIGEIILVVIGILIALQINNWNENRKERNIEQILLNQLYKDFESNNTLIKNGLADYQRNLKYQDAILKHTGPKVNIPENKKTLDSLSVLNYPKVALVFGSLNFTSQQIERINNEQLKVSLSKFPSIFSSYQETENRLANLTINQRQMHQKYVSLLNYMPEFNQEKFESDYLGWLRNREFQNITVDKNWVIRQAVSELNELSEQNKIILDIIKIEVKKK